MSIISRKQVQATRTDAEKDNVVVPETMEEYCMKPKPRSNNTVSDNNDNIEMDDFYDDDCCYDFDDDTDDEEGGDGDGEDSGNGEN